MSDAEKLIKRHGGQLVSQKTHKVYVIGSIRFTLHHGTKPNPQEIFKVKSQLRKMGFIS